MRFAVTATNGSYFIFFKIITSGADKIIFINNTIYPVLLLVLSYSFTRSVNIRICFL